MDFLTDPDIWIGFLTLLALEIVLGIDNVVFISILASKLPVEQQPRARQVGLSLALITRLLLLFTISWIIGLTEPLFEVFGREFSGRDLILLIGGLFLLAKATYEIHDKLEGESGHASERVAGAFVAVVVQIMIMDIVFSLDSVITAVGMVDELAVMVAAVVVAVAVMLLSSGPISRFVDTHPTVKVLALSFLLLIGLSLMLEGFHQHIPKGYIYFAMGFSLFVELINLRARAVSKAAKPVALRQRYQPEPAQVGAAHGEPPSTAPSGTDPEPPEQQTDPKSPSGTG